MKTTMNVLILIALFVVSCQSRQGTKESASEKDTVKEQAARIYTEPQTATADATLEAGKKVYDDNCLACHQAGGEGAPGMFPPLNKNEYTSDKTKLISTVLHGVEGAIKVNGTEYNNIMPAQDYLSDEEIAAVLTYVLKSFVKSEETVSAEEVASVRTAQ